MIFEEDKNFNFGFAYVTSRETPWVSSINFSQFDPAVWPAIANIYANISVKIRNIHICKNI